MKPEYQQWVEKIVSSSEFASAGRMKDLLIYLAKQTEAAKETVIGAEVFGRDPDYDPKTDGIVRSEVRRLRSKLQDYYAGSGVGDSLRLEIPKGQYLLVGRQIVAAPGKSSSRLWWVVAGVGLLSLAVGGSWRWGRLGPSHSEESHLLTDSLGQATQPALTPDGELLAYTFRGDAPGIYLRRWKEAQGQRLPGTGVEDSSPALSWDGRRIAFLRYEKPGFVHVMVQNITGGTAARWSTVERRDRIAWLPNNGELVISDGVSRGAYPVLLRLNSRGERRILTQPVSGVVSDGQPTISPDGKILAFARARDAAVEEICTLALDKQYEPQGEVKQITSEKRHNSRFAFLPDGRGIVASLPRGRSIRALYRCDLDHPDRMIRLGSTQLLASDPAIAGKTGLLVYSVALDDVNVYRLRRNAPPQAISPSNTLDSSPAISPDSTKLAIRSQRSGTSEIWVMSSDGREPKRLTFAEGPTTGSPRWSPAGDYLAFDSRIEGNSDIYLVSPQGGEARRLTNSNANEVVPSWSRDGKFVYYASDASGRYELWKLALAGNAQPVRVTDQGGFWAQESADGQWLYYAKRAPARGIWRRPLAGGPEQMVVDVVEGLWGAWSVGVKGLYWIENPTDRKARMLFRPFSGSPEQTLHTLFVPPIMWDGAFAINADDSEIYFAQLDRATSDLYRVDLR